jgi:hypothetical protein
MGTLRPSSEGKTVTSVWDASIRPIASLQGKKNFVKNNFAFIPNF